MAFAKRNRNLPNIGSEERNQAQNHRNFGMGDIYPFRNFGIEILNMRNLGISIPPGHNNKQLLDDAASNIAARDQYFWPRQNKCNIGQGGVQISVLLYPSYYHFPLILFGVTSYHPISKPILCYLTSQGIITLIIIYV